MKRNIVICCDGTAAEYGTDDVNTNVVRLFERLGPDSDCQISYYDPGVGTYSRSSTFTGRTLENLSGMAWGTGVTAKTHSAYRYLMDEYEPGDRIFLFGYSRGAYTVRLLAAMLNRVGLLTRGSNHLIPYASRLARSPSRQVSANFRDSFSRICRPLLVGVWDTVASVGWGPTRDYYLNQPLSSDVRYGYQALAVDERRRQFRPAIWDESNVGNQTIEQVWFPGYHADVGGQHSNRRISDLSLVWMITRAKAQGLITKDAWIMDLNPDALGEVQPSHRYIWRLPGLTKPREIPPGSLIHESVFKRIAAIPSYQPRIPDHYTEVA